MWFLNLRSQVMKQRKGRGSSNTSCGVEKVLHVAHPFQIQEEESFAATKKHPENIWIRNFRCVPTPTLRSLPLVLPIFWEKSWPIGMFYPAFDTRLYL